MKDRRLTFGLTHDKGIIYSCIDKDNVTLNAVKFIGYSQEIKIPKYVFKYFMQHLNNIGGLLEEERLEMCMRGAKVPYHAPTEMAEEENEPEEQNNMSDESFDPNKILLNI